MKLSLFNDAGEYVSLENPTLLLVEVAPEGETHGAFNIHQRGGTLTLRGGPSVILQTSPTSKPGINLDGGFWCGTPDQIAQMRDEAAEMLPPAQLSTLDLTEHPLNERIRRSITEDVFGKPMPTATAGELPTPGNIIPGNFGGPAEGAYFEQYPKPPHTPLYSPPPQPVEPLQATVDRLVAMLAGWRPLAVPLRIDGVVQNVTILARATPGPIGVVPPPRSAA